MPGKIVQDFTGSRHNSLSEGCRLCHLGAKMVLFVTGICGRDCYYCPISDERRNVDAVYVNEQKISSDEELLEEALRMDALGTGITGGEPLSRPDRVLHYIRLLKSTFGKKHHIHLYTCTAPSRDLLRQLSDAGLDEIRFHPPEERWPEFYGSEYHRALLEAIALGMSAGIEIPATGKIPEIERAVIESGSFINLNELEFSDTNCERMKQRGYRLKDDRSNAADSSESIAYQIVLNSIANTRYCSSRFKDAVQLRERLKRTASKVSRPFDEVTDDGTVIYGEIRGDVKDIIELLMQTGVPQDMYHVDEEVVEIAWWILDDIKEELAGMEKSIIERYPLKFGLVVERIPL